MVIPLAEFTTVDFTGFTFGTSITTQYADVGVIFPDGTDFISGPDSIFVDDWGLTGGVHTPIEMDFLSPQHAIATDFIGILLIRLFYRDQMIFESDVFGVGPGFVGFVSDTPFDSAVFLDPFDSVVAIDNLYFDPPVIAADLDGIDLGILLGSWSIPPGGPGCDGKKAPGGCPADLNHDGGVDGLDLGLLLDAWTIWRMSTASIAEPVLMLIFPEGATTRRSQQRPDGGAAARGGCGCPLTLASPCGRLGDLQVMAPVRRRSLHGSLLAPLDSRIRGNDGCAQLTPAAAPADTRGALPPPAG